MPLTRKPIAALPIVELKVSERVVFVPTIAKTRQLEIISKINHTIVSL